MRLIASVLAVLLVFGGPTRADVIIGVAGPLTGPYQTFGQQMLTGVKAAVDAANGSGGINGETVRIVSADDQCDNRKAEEAAQKLIDARVDVVIGHFCSNPSLAAARLYFPVGITMIAPAATLSTLTTQNLNNVLRVASRDDMQGAFAARHILKLRPDAKIAILDDGTGASKATTAQFLIALGKAPALAASIVPDAKDYFDIIATLKPLAITDVYLAMSATDAGHIVAAAREHGLQPQFLGSDALLADQFWEASGPAGTGTLVSFPIDPQASLSARPVIASLKLGGQTAEGTTLPAYAAVQLYVAAAKAKGAHAGVALAAWLRSGVLIETVEGPLAFNGQGDVQDLRFQWYDWNNGAFRVVRP